MKSVRHTPFWILVLLLCFVSVGFLIGRSEFKSRIEELVPSGNPEKVMIETQGNRNVYFVLDALHPLSVTVKGPTRLEVITRVHMEKFSKKSIPYKILIKSVDERIDVYPKKGKVSSVSKYVSSKKEGFVDQKDKIVLQIPKGKHLYTFALDVKASYRVHLRFLSKPDVTPKKSWRRVIPEGHAGVVTIFDGKKEKLYYLSSNQTPVKFEAEGPAMVKVIIRVLFDAMPSLPNRAYAVSVFENNSFKSSHSFIGKVSKVSKLRGESMPYVKLPGIRKTFYIKIPAGKHKYFLSPSTAEEVALRPWISKLHKS
jgi:hypothetical protein